MDRLTGSLSSRLNYRPNCLNVATTATEHPTLIRHVKSHPNPDSLFGI
jgi:hypothetical protein